MSKEIDERVVSMQFENKNFEKNANQSMSTLDKLKKAMNFDKVKGSFADISKAASKVDLSGIGNGIIDVQNKFSFLDTFALTTFQRISNYALTTGKKMASMFTIEPLTSGFREYETKINAVQTIMANVSSKGYELKDVTKVLNELNTYADKTIYNFTEMTKNIGTFTAAGVDLKVAANSIQGIANLAATTGSNSYQASLAMYQLSQAMAAGTVKLQDWNSVVNAGMGGETFQNALKQTAREMGIAVDDMIKANGSFRESLKDGWVTTEVLNTTLKKFTVDGAKKYAEAMVKNGKYTKKQAEDLIKQAQMMEDAATKVKTFTQLIDTMREALGSGWAQTWEIVFGDFEEAKALFTEISDSFGVMVQASSDSRNALLQGWKDLGGRTSVLNGLRNILGSIAKAFDAVGKAFRNVFPPATSKQLADISKAFEEFTNRIKMSDETAKNIQNTFEGLFSILKFGVDILSTFVGGVLKLSESLFTIIDVVLKVTGTLGEFISSIFKGTESGVDDFNKGVHSMVDALNLLVKTLVDFVDPAIHGFTSLLKGFGTFITNLLGTIFGTITTAIQTGDISTLMALLQGGAMVGIYKAFKKSSNKLVSSIEDTLSTFTKADLWSNITDTVTNTLDSIRKSMELWQQNLQSKTILNLALSMGILALAIGKLSSIDSEKLSESLGALTIMLGEMLGAINILTKIGAGSKILNFKGIISLVPAMIALSSGLLILSKALKEVSLIDTEKMYDSVVTLGETSLILVTTVGLISKLNLTMTIRTAAAISIFSLSMKNMAEAIGQMGSLKWDVIQRGLKGIATILTELTIFMAATSSINKYIGGASITTSFNMIIIAKALNELSKSVELFGNIKWANMQRALKGIGTLMAILAGFNLISGLSSHVIKSAISLTVISGSLLIAAKSLNEFGSMQWDVIQRGLEAMGGTMAILAATLKLIPSKNVILKTASFSAMILTITQLTPALNELGKMSWEEIGRALSVMAGTFASLLAVSAIMNAANISGIENFLTLAATIGIISSSLSGLSNIGWTGTAVVITTFVGALSSLGIMTKILKPLIPTMFKLAGALTALSGAFALLGASLVGTGIGLATVLTSLAASFAALGALQWDTIAKGLTTIASVFATMLIGVKVFALLQGSIVSFAASMALLAGSAAALMASISMIAFAFSSLSAIGKDGIDNAVYALQESLKAIVYLLPQVIGDLAESIVELLISTIESIAKAIPRLADSLMIILVGTFEALNKYMPTLTKLIAEMLISMLGALEEYVPDLVNAFMSFFGTVFEAIATSIQNADTDALLKATQMVGIFAVIAKPLAALPQLLGGAMKGLAAAGVLIGELALIIAAAGAIAQIPGLEWLISEGGDILETVGISIGQFVGGLAGGLAKGISSSLPEYANNLSQFMINLQPFITGAQSISPDVAKGVLNLSAAILAITGADLLNNVNKLFNLFSNESSLEKFANDLVYFGKAMVNFSSIVTGKINEDAVLAASNAGKLLAEMQSKIPNSGGVIGFFAGEHDFEGFANGIIKFGYAITRFSNTLRQNGGIEEGMVTSAASAGKMLAELQATIPTDGGIISFFAGDHDFGSFGEGIIAYGKAIAEFSKSISGENAVSTDAVTSAVNAGKLLVALQQMVPEEGFWFWEKDSTLSDFSEDLPDFGADLKDFYDEISEIDGAKIGSIANSLTPLINTLKTLSGFDSDSVSEFATSINVLANANIKGLIASFKGKTEDFSSVGKALSKSLSSGFGSMSTQFKNTALSIVNEAIKALEGKKSKFSDIGKTYITNLKTSIEKNTRTATNAINSLVDACVKKADSKQTGFYNAGKNMVQGLANGISSNKSIATWAAANVANAALIAAKEALDEHSPSKEMYKIGEFAILGFANAFKDSTSYIGNVSGKFASRSLNEINRVVNTAIKTMSLDLDMQPTITPIMDMTNVESGFSRISQLSSKLTLSSGSVASLNRSIKIIGGQNGNNNSDVVDAINDLNRSVKDSDRSNNYNINGVYLTEGDDVSAAIETLTNYIIRSKRR